MNFTLESPWIRLVVSPDRGVWSLSTSAAGYPQFKHQQPAISYRSSQSSSLFRRSRRVYFPLRDPTGIPHMASSIHGSLVQQIFTTQGPGDLRLDLEFALPHNLPALFWSARLCNTTDRPLWIDRLELLDAATHPASTHGSLASITPKTASFFSNGWQSWSYSSSYLPGEQYRRTRLGPIRAATDFNPGTPYPFRRGRFGSDMFGVLGDRSARKVVVAGFLSQRRHFGSLAAELSEQSTKLRMWANGDSTRLDPGAEMHTDWASIFYADLDDFDAIGDYFEAVGRECGVANLPERPPTGWCSWYQFSAENLLRGTVTAEDIRRNLHAISRMCDDLPLDVIQIDDGFQAAVGDWLEYNLAFPDGVAGLASEVSSAGFTPGLWLAPFIVHPQSKLAAAHPDWLIRNASGRPSSAGFLWNTFPHGLDLTHPEVLEHTRRVIRTTVEECGFPYLKLDFLYAGVLDGRRHDPTQSRAQALTAGLRAVREAAGPQTTILACGCPLGPAVGWVDAMRISADTARRWIPAFNRIEFFFSAEPNFPSARNACHNSLTRAGMHRRWWINDPDCLLVRPQTDLSIEEVQSIATVIALTGGSLLLSDDLPALNESKEGNRRLRLAQSLLPPIGKRPQIIDLLEGGTPHQVRLDLKNGCGAWTLLALFNWDDQLRSIALDALRFGLDLECGYWLRSFWTGETLAIPPGSLESLCLDTPAHGVTLLAVRPIETTAPRYVGSDLHISQGLEVAGWDWDATQGHLALRMERPGNARGSVDIALPGPPRSVTINDQPIEAQAIGMGCYRLGVEFTGSGECSITI